MFSCHCRKWWYYILDFDCNDKMNNRKDKIPKSLHSVNFKTLSFSLFSLTFLRILDLKVWANDFMSPKITHLRSITSQTRHHSRSRHLTVKNGTQSSIPKQSDPKIFRKTKTTTYGTIYLLKSCSFAVWRTKKMKLLDAVFCVLDLSPNVECDVSHTGSWSFSQLTAVLWGKPRDASD